MHLGPLSRLKLLLYKFWAVCISRECWEMPGNAGKFFKLAKIGVFSAVDYLSSIIMPFNNISMYVYKQKET